MQDKEAKFRKRLLDAKSQLESQIKRTEHRETEDTPWVKALEHHRGARSSSAVQIQINDSEDDTHSANSGDPDEGDPPGAVEVFCGIAHLTLALQKPGLKQWALTIRAAKISPWRKLCG